MEQGKNTSDEGYGILPHMEGLTPDIETPLRSGYAYLIRSSVRMTELYPLLGEILFCSCATRGNEPLYSEQGWETNSNLIAMFLDDSPSNLLMSLDAKGKTDKELMRSFIDKCESEENAPYVLPAFSAWLDTYASFSSHQPRPEPVSIKNNSNAEQASSEDGKKSDPPYWLRQSITGSGNPMSIYRFFRSAGNEKARGEVNVFLMNSLSNLYRSLGLSETAALVKRILEDIWLQNTEDQSIPRAQGNSNGKAKPIKDTDGLFFGILQEGVMGPAEENYLESFFDGIYSVSPYYIGNFRIPCLRTLSLPLETKLPKKKLYLPNEQFKAMKNEDEAIYKKLSSLDHKESAFITTFDVPLDA